MAEQRGECCWCGAVGPFVYVDVLRLGWCRSCYEDTFLESFTPGSEQGG